MTKAKANIFATTIAAKAQTVKSAANKKRAMSLSLLATDARVLNVLTENKIDAQRFVRALYATEKTVKFLRIVTRDVINASEFEKNSFVTIKTALNALEHKAHMTRRDIESAILIDCAIADERKHIVYARKAKIEAVAQVQQCYDMLLTMQVAKEVARDTLEIQDTKMMQLFSEKLAQVAI